jgi:hypothetical protein
MYPIIPLEFNNAAAQLILGFLSAVGTAIGVLWSFRP